RDPAAGAGRGPAHAAVRLPHDTRRLRDALRARRIRPGRRIVSFYDLASRRELVVHGGAFNVLLMGEDVPAAWDNWDIDRDQRQKLAPQDRLVRRRVVADGPLQLRVRSEYRLGRQSVLTQDVVLHSTTPRVDFDTVVEWREKYQF